MKCRKRYGSRRHLICGRLSGHRGRHAQRMTVAEMSIAHTGRVA